MPADFLQSKAVRVSALFPDQEERGQVLRRLRTIHNKARENFEELIPKMLAEK